MLALGRIGYPTGVAPLVKTCQRFAFSSCRASQCRTGTIAIRKMPIAMSTV